jgi:hypothetical protein
MTPPPSGFSAGKPKLSPLAVFTDFVAFPSGRVCFDLRDITMPWPIGSVNDHFPRQADIDEFGNPLLTATGLPIMISPARWLMRHRAMLQVVYAPGFPQIIEGQLLK